MPNFKPIAREAKALIKEAAHDVEDGAKHGAARIDIDVNRAAQKVDAAELEISGAVPWVHGPHGSAANGAANLLPGIKPGWVHRRARNGKGWVWQAPGAVGDAHSIRIMEPMDRYPRGYVRFYNGEGNGQPLTLTGKPGPKAGTHFDIDEDGHWSVPKGW